MKRKEIFGLSVIFILAALYNMEADPSIFVIEQSALFNVDRKRLFKFVTQADKVPRWFQWIKQFRSADKKPITVGKHYEAVSQYPLYGELPMLFRVMNYVPETEIVLESNAFTKPKVEIGFEAYTPSQSRLTFKMTFQRKSALFQFLMGPLLYTVGSNELQNALIRLRVLFPY